MTQMPNVKQFVYSDINYAFERSNHRHLKVIGDNGHIYDVAKDYKSLYDIVTK